MRVFGILMLTVTVLAAASCGQLDPPAQRLADAPARTAAAETARMALESSTHMGGSGDARMDITVTGEGEVDFAAEQVQLTITMPGPMPGDMEMVVDGDVVYMRMPFVDEEQWVRVDAAGSPDQMMQPGMAGDPTEALSALGAVGGEIEELGTEEVRGAATHGYAFEAPAGEVFPTADDQGERLSDVAVALEAWLDAEGRVRRLSQTVDLGELMSALEPTNELPEDTELDFDMVGEQTTVIEFFDFGEPVVIEIPDEDLVEDQDVWQEGFSESVEEHMELRPSPLEDPPTPEPGAIPPPEPGAVPPQEPQAEPVPGPQPAPGVSGEDSSGGGAETVEPEQTPAPDGDTRADPLRPE